ncbi:LCP family protein [Frankia sp. AgKG'84/4]|uniref:LCP family protein n=1 Tax=Frankia sp. AgKG'84/4 TaxID=573490 RepID=UPI00200F9D39|nr:LCP family protein [Frankia sp. AgKG'84/4]MCL9794795.1 LCP family protein [Frankia sp. AgKG'84/4]
MLPAELDPRRPRRRRTPWQRLALVVSAFASALVLAISTLGWAAYRHLDSAIVRERWTIDGARPAAVAGEQNILLLGDDSRAGTDGEYGAVDGVRSDTTIIVHLARDGSATLLWFPRDMLVPVIPHSRASARDGRAKLTEVLALAGVPGLVSTLETLTGLKVDHTVSINLAGFRAMTEAVGGVTVCVTPLPGGSTRNLHDAMSGWNGHLGLNRLDGEQALAFVRTRYALGDERLRILRQQQFLSRLLAAATSAGVLTSPQKLTALLDAVGGTLRVDSGLDQEELLRLAKRINGLRSNTVRFVTVPTRVALRSDGAVDDLGTIPPHGAVLLADQEGLDRVLAPLRPAPATPAARPSTGFPAAVAPVAVPVAAVRNASGRTGLAAATVDALRSLGFTGPMTTSTAAGQPLTEIHHSPALTDAGRTLSARLPGSRLVEDGSAPGDGLVVILGTTFPGLPTGSATTTTGTGTGTGTSVSTGPATTTNAVMTTGRAATSAHTAVGAGAAGVTPIVTSTAGTATPFTINTACTP